MDRDMSRKRPHNFHARSQRKKHRDNSLADNAPVLLSEELKGALQSRNQYKDEDLQGMVLEKGKNKGVLIEDAGRKKGKLSSKQAKRFRKLIEQKEQKKERAALLESLGSNRISSDQAKLLQKTTTLSSKMTLKGRLKQELKETRAGISVTQSRAGKGLVITRTRAPTPDHNESDSDMSESSEDEKQHGDESDVSQSKATTVVMPKVVQVAKKISGPSAQELMRRRKVKPGPAAVFVPVKRPPEIQEARLLLPILQEEHSIIEAIKQNPVVIICGETGSGKTTQVPQFLYEAGFTRRSQTDESKKQYDMIGITEPRRIAAVSMASRVGRELGLTKKEVSYQIRYDKTATTDTELKFMTDGVLAKEIESDFSLSKYSVIIIDEAHERSMATDIILGLLSRIVPLREKLSKRKDSSESLCPLKLVIMSATLRVKEFTENTRLFPMLKHIPVLSIDARQHPVTTHFSKRTVVDVDNVAEAFRKTCQIHEQLPSGGILVFMTGRWDITDLCTRLKQKYNSSVRKKSKNGKGDKTEDVEQKGQENGDKEAKASEKKDILSPDEHNLVIDGILSGDEDCEDDEDLILKVPKKIQMTLTNEETSNFGPLHVLPLYANLAADQQAKIFESVPDGHRLCVVATNVAETSLTIPGIRYVIDTGQVKQRHYHSVTGVTSMEVGWISKASAAQRAGRAGRTGPGHCYRLYSSAVFENEFTEFTEPEILRLPADGLVLQMKAMGIDRVANFPFPTPPDSAALRKGEVLLKLLGALDGTSNITSLGLAMSQFPVAPRYSKMLCVARHYDCFAHVVAIVAAITVGEIFQPISVQGDSENVDAEEGIGLWKTCMKEWKSSGVAGGGDFARLLSAVGECDQVASQRGSDLEGFCASKALRYKAVLEVQKLRKQLHSRNDIEFEESDDTKSLQVLSPPTQKQLSQIRQIVLAAFGDHVARISPDPEFAKLGLVSYTCEASNEPVFIHPDSVLLRQKPDVVVYHELVQGKKQVYMKGVNTVSWDWIPTIVPVLCDFSKPMENPSPRYDPNADEIYCHITGSFGSLRWPLKPSESVFPQIPDRYRWFARFFLEAKVFPKLAKYVDGLKNKPDIMLKPWVKERVLAILKPLVDNKISSRKGVLKAWKENPKFLLQAYSLWIDSKHHAELAMMWPPKD
eukprot:m.46738 g.46738  ORF g.46738 m.46738 type:complete len:1156 (+) comp10401_c0_seq1:96-3563(+)